jgi:hypothetical protein
VKSGARCAPTVKSTSATAHVTVTDSKGGSAARDSATFVVGSMTDDWEVHSSAIPNTVLFYLRLAQDTTGGVTGLVIDKLEQQLGRTDPAGQGRIDAAGNLTTLRLKFTNGNDITMTGRMQPSGTEIVGTFSNTSAIFDGKALNGLPFNLVPD